MARNTKTDQLRGVQMFSACTDKELAQIARACDEVVVDSDAVIVEEGSAGEDFYLIATGEAAVTRGGQPVATLRSGQYFGELSLLDPGPRNATVTAATPMTLLKLGRSEFGAVLDSWPGVAHKLLEQMAKRLRLADERAVTN
ncbi:MAG TPA: cyclic nucleotide-binding domain-containing protein [Acidimicrobiales bacterium]|nr:cyclic nucleotide-binding domain-containing protein [Acidimicrobiales bacterium]